MQNTFGVYLNFQGNCEEAFDFYKSILGGTQEEKHRFSDMPTSPEAPMEIPENEKNLIMHINLNFGNFQLMGADMPSFAPVSYNPGNQTAITLYPDSVEEGKEIFEKLSAGGRVEMPFEEQFFGYFASFTDKYGINWMLSYRA